ncbi:MAG: DegV family protein [Dehalococcoidia bacterium]|jgi:DegV family protein with EDD domain
MAIKVITDSTADIPPALVQELGITIVPLYVHFGTETFRDRLDMEAEEFYQRLVRSQALPTTSAPSPGTFTEAYREAAEGADGVLSIHLSAKLSATVSSALLARDEMGPGLRVEVVDSQSVSMGLGLLVIAAARAIRSGASLDEASELLRQAIPRTHVYALLDTLEYLKKGGRIGKAQALLGSLLNIKPLIAIRQGEVLPLERVRTRSRGLQRLKELAEGLPNPQGMAVLYTPSSQEAQTLAGQIKHLCPGGEIHMSTLSPVLGAHCGPGTIGLGAIAGE